MMDVVPLCHHEGAGIDAPRLHSILAHLGAERGRELINEIAQEMALRLAQLERQYLAGDAAAIRREAMQLARLADQVGMRGFCRVAQDVRSCAARGDMVAFAATWARLTRIGDGALSEIRRIAADRAP